jgi:hypothetical protein
MIRPLSDEPQKVSVNVRPIETSEICGLPEHQLGVLDAVVVLGGPVLLTDAFRA